MIHLAISFLIGSVIFTSLYFTHVLRLGEALVPALLALMVAFVVLALRTKNRLEMLFMAVQKEAQAGHMERAIELLKSGYALARYQLGVRSQIDVQIGSLYFIQKKFAEALPYLRGAGLLAPWQSHAMLAVIHFKRKRHEEAKKLLAAMVKRSKRASLAWNLYAYCLCELGENAAAMKVLSDGDVATKGDPKIRDNLLALQNGKKMKMKAYGLEWYQFHLEAPPTQIVTQSPYGARARRRQWN